MKSSRNSDSSKSSCSGCASASPMPSSSIELADQRPTQVYRQFSDVVHSEMYQNRIPSTGTIEIMENCNFRCLHCYQGMKKARQKMSGDKWCSIIDELAEAGTFWLLITGGEPLLHPDFERIYRHAYMKGIIVTVFTNARMINDSHIRLFQELPPFAVEVTLYGASEEMYQRVTGTKGSFQLVRDNIRRIRDAGITIKLKSVAFHPLADDLAAMQAYAEDEMGLEFRFDTKIDPGIYGESFDEIRLTPEQLVDLEDRLIGRENLAGDMRALLEINKRNVEKTKSNELLYRCGAGKNSFYIDYKGYVHTCSSGRLEKEAFDLNKMSFAEVWNEGLPQVVLQKRRNLNSQCMKCEYREICDACPATAQLATGDKEGRPQYVCQITMARKTRLLQNEGVSP